MSDDQQSDWKTHRLSSLLMIPKKDRLSNPKNYELLTVKLYGLGVTRTGKYPKPTEQSRPYYRRFEGEILIGRQNFHNGGIGIVGKDTAGLIASNAISSYLPTKLGDRTFLLNYLLQPQFLNQVENNASGTGQKEISEEQIGNLVVKIPSLPIQQKIAEILTSVDEVIENTQSQINKLEDLKKATMNELLTKGIGHTEFKETEIGRIPKSWNIKTIDTICYVDKESLSATTSPLYSFHYIDLSCVSTGALSVPSAKINFETSPSRARRKFKKGDVLISTVRPNLKGFVYIDFEPKNLIASTGFAVLTPKNEIEGKYLYYSFIGNFVAMQIDSLVAGSNYPAINSSELKEIRVYVPPIKEQIEISEKLTSIDARILDLKTCLEKRRNLKNSLMQDLLTGKVRVTVN